MGSVVQRRLAFAAATTALSGTIGLTVASQYVNGRRPRPLEAEEFVVNTLPKAMKPLGSYGVAIVPQILDERMLTLLRHTELYQTMPTELRQDSSAQRRRRRPPGARRGISTNKEAEQEEDLWPPSASGRYHRREDSFNNHDKQVFEELERKILPLVFDFFDAEAQNGEEDEEGFFFVVKCRYVG